ncbi:MAG: hypothetical protein AAGG68_01615 [Bacteroidota bacterium]
MTKAKLHRRWLFQSISGLIISSMGLCMVVEAGILKFQEASTLEWIGAGTVALMVFNAGLCLLIDALRFRMLRDQMSNDEK